MQPSEMIGHTLGCLMALSTSISLLPVFLPHSVTNRLGRFCFIVKHFFVVLIFFSLLSSSYDST